MKKLIVIVMMLAIIMAGCSGESECKTDVGILGLSMGESAHSVKEKLHHANIEFNTKDFGRDITAEKSFEWLGVNWGVLNCKIGDEGLEFIEIWSAEPIDASQVWELCTILMEKGFSAPVPDERIANAFSLTLNSKYEAFIAENPHWTSLNIYTIDK